MSRRELLFIPVACVFIGLVVMMCYLFFRSSPPRDDDGGDGEKAAPDVFSVEVEEAKEEMAGEPEMEDWSRKAELHAAGAAPPPPPEGDGAFGVPEVASVEGLVSAGQTTKPSDLGFLGVFCCKGGDFLPNGQATATAAPGELPDEEGIPLTES